MTRTCYTIGVCLGLVAAGCQPSPPPAKRSEPPPMNASPPCRAVLTPTADGELGLRFVLSNPTPQPITLDVDYPFLQFRVRAEADGAELPVVQPTLDLPVNPTTATVPASGTLELPSPMRLRIRTGAPSQDRFVWSIAHAPEGVQLTFTLELPPPFDQPFAARP